MLTYIIVIAALLLPCILFAEDVKDIIRKIWDGTIKWVRNGKEEYPDPGETVKAVLVLVGLGFVVYGNFSLINHALHFILPIENPSHIAWSIVCLGALMGLGLHSPKPELKWSAVILSIAVIVLLSFISYAQMHETIMMEGDEQTTLKEEELTSRPDIIAAGQFGLIIMMEIYCFYLLFDLAGKSIGYLALPIMTPLWMMGIAAWLSCIAKQSPRKLAEWIAALRARKGKLYLEQISLRQKLADDAPLETQREFIKRSEDINRKTFINHFKTINIIHHFTSAWLRFYSFFAGLFRGPSGGNRLYGKTVEFVEHTFDKVLEEVKRRIESIGNSTLGGNGAMSNREIEISEDAIEGFEIDNSDGKKKKKKKKGKGNSGLLSLIFILVFSIQVEAQRLIIWFGDVTGSYPYRIEACDYTANHVASNLSPNDIFQGFKLGNPTEKASLSITFPKLDPEITQKNWKTIFDYKPDKREFDSIWSRRDSLQRTLQQWLLEDIKDQKDGGTFWHDMLAYASIQFSSFQGEKYFFVASDLMNEAPEQEKTRLPPSELYNFSEVTVVFFYVPHESYQEWEELNDAWESYFQEAGVKYFKMLSVASTSIHEILPSPNLPRKFPRFKVSRND